MQKQDPKKVQWPKIVTPKKANFSLHKIENSRISFFSTPKKVLAKIFISKIVHQKIDNPQKVPSRKFQTQKRSSHLPVTDTPEYPPWGKSPSMLNYSPWVCWLAYFSKHWRLTHNCTCISRPMDCQKWYLVHDGELAFFDLYRHLLKKWRLCMAWELTQIYQVQVEIWWNNQFVMNNRMYSYKFWRQCFKVFKCQKIINKFILLHIFYEFFFQFWYF